MAIDKMIYRLGRPDPALADTAIADGWWAKGGLRHFKPSRWGCIWNGGDGQLYICNFSGKRAYHSLNRSGETASRQPTRRLLRTTQTYYFLLFNLASLPKHFTRHGQRRMCISPAGGCGSPINRCIVSAIITITLSSAHAKLQSIPCLPQRPTRHYPGWAPSGVPSISQLDLWEN